MNTEIEAIKKEIKELEKEYNFHCGLANFHQKAACSECFAEYRDFHLKKMKECDDLCEEIRQQIIQLCQKKV
jgi:hypothetical protein